MSARARDMAMELYRNEEFELQLQREFEDEKVFIRQILFEKYKPSTFEKIIQKARISCTNN